MRYQEFTYENADGEEVTVELAMRWEICERCQGEGTHSNPNIDENGLDPDLANDPEFMEGYMRGVYDVRCEACKGTGKVLDIDFDRNDPDTCTAWLDKLQREEDDRREQEMEARWGC